MFTVIDLETTGVNHETDAIVEMAAVNISHNGEIGASCQSLVSCGIPIPPAASAVHHIIAEDLVDAPKVQSVLSMITSFDKSPDGKIIYVAHNSRFEQAFLSKFLSGDEVWICTYKAARRVWPDAPTFTNQGLRYFLELPIDRDIGPAHRALPDCYVTAALFIKLMKHCSVDDMIKWTKLPILEKICKFGKHYDTPWNEIPKDYLRWIVKNGSFDENVDYTARVNLGLIQPE